MDILLCFGLLIVYVFPLFALFAEAHQVPQVRFPFPVFRFNPTSVVLNLLTIDILSSSLSLNIIQVYLILYSLLRRFGRVNQFPLLSLTRRFHLSVFRFPFSDFRFNITF